nr:restriction endonuclease subunit S [Rummeliibacillus suwonensis]
MSIIRVSALAWEQRKLSEVASYRNGKAHEKDISDSGDFVVVNSKFVSTSGRIKKYTNKQIEPLEKDEIAFVLSDVPNGKAIAKTFLVPESNKYSLNQRIAGITSYDNTDPYFLSELMNRHHYFLRFDDGVGQTNLSKKDVEDFEEFYPAVEEQRQIGQFFKRVDHLITLHQRE